MLKQYSDNPTENALMAWNVNFQDRDNNSLYTQITENLYCIETVLKDKDNVLSNLDKVMEMVGELKKLSAAAAIRNGSLEVDDVLKPSEKREIAEINEETNKFDSFFK